MSEPAPEAKGGGKAGGSAFAKKIGPLPVWAWMGIGLVAAIGISALSGGKKKNKADQSSQAAQNLSAQQQAALQNAAFQTPPYVTQNYASSAATAPATSSSSTMTVIMPPSWHYGQGPPGTAVQGWGSMSSPQAWQPMSAHGTPQGQPGPQGGDHDRGGGSRGGPPSRQPSTPVRPGSGGGHGGGHGGHGGGGGKRGGGGKH